MPPSGGSSARDPTNMGPFWCQGSILWDKRLRKFFFCVCVLHHSTLQGSHIRTCQEHRFQLLGTRLFLPGCAVQWLLPLTVASNFLALSSASTITHLGVLAQATSTYRCLSFPLCKMVLIRKLLTLGVRIGIQGCEAGEVVSAGLGHSESLINLEVCFFFFFLSLVCFTLKWKWK